MADGLRAAPINLPPFRAAILDMDGLVVDSEPTYCEAWRRAAAEQGRELAEAFFLGLFGRHADDVEAALRAELGAAFERGSFYRAAERHWLAHLDSHGLQRMPGLDALLAAFRKRGVPYALATNSDAPYARLCLRHAGLEAEFGLIVTRDQVRQGKPAPDVFLEAARRLGVAPAECLALEDSATGLAAARAAGTITVLVQRRAAERERLGKEARLAVAALGELAEWLEAEA